MLPFPIENPIFTKEENNKMSTSGYFHGNKIIIAYYDETFLPIPNTHYCISNFGTLYNCKYNNILKGGLDGGGYIIYAIPELGTKKAHRLIMETFNPVVNMENLQVNHIDGNKLNNYYNPIDPLNNLEWCTRQENMKHAYATGLMKNSTLPGEKNGRAIRTNEMIHIICKYLEMNLTAPEIAKLLNVECDCAFESLLTHIRRKTGWRCVSDQYNIVQHHHWNK